MRTDGSRSAGIRHLTKSPRNSQTSEILTGKDLICENVSVESKVMKKVYNKHTGQDRVKVFPIGRIRERPLRCYDSRIQGIMNIEAKIIKYKVT